MMTKEVKGFTYVELIDYVVAHGYEYEVEDFEGDGVEVTVWDRGQEGVCFGFDRLDKPFVYWESVAAWGY